MPNLNQLLAQRQSGGSNRSINRRYPSNRHWNTLRNVFPFAVSPYNRTGVRQRAYNRLIAILNTYMMAIPGSTLYPNLDVTTMTASAYRSRMAILRDDLQHFRSVGNVEYSDHEDDLNYF